MPAPLLEEIAQSLNYGELPETWQVPEFECFSPAKTLYDYQTDALRNAARALYLYYGKQYNWRPDEPQETNDNRKERLLEKYRDFADVTFPIYHRYETAAKQENDTQNPIFRILSEYIAPQGNVITYQALINRMCFWMATGSGKTLVMIKLIEYLHRLKRHGEIPPHNTLILAPSDHLLGQIRRTVDEFNQSGLHIDLVPLRDSHRVRQGQLGDTEIVYYHRSDNISDVQKDALTDYRQYENDGKWYVFLDEAHKGTGDSKRKAYYGILARNGFLFNFSATFTDREDLTTTVKQYNLERFIQNGHGKNIYISKGEYSAFKNRKEEINPNERLKIVLKSLITLTHVSMRVDELRKKTGNAQLYHAPLMLTLANSVNTDTASNDLWNFFNTLEDLATARIDAALFKTAKQELVAEWQDTQLFFGSDGSGIAGVNDAWRKKLTVAAVREAVFHSKRPGALQLIRSNDNKEVALQLTNSDAPFGLIRIGNTSKWRKELLTKYDETTTVGEKSFFDEVNKDDSTIKILMGSRSFFESWDSNRPNVINFINIGSSDAKKFVVQSVGRGVRIEPLPGKRRRYASIADEINSSPQIRDLVHPPETLFLFATKRNAIKAVLEGLESEQGSSTFERLQGFEKSPVPKIGNRDMPLLVPKYKEEQSPSSKAKFAMSDSTLARFKEWLQQTSDSVLAIRDGLTPLRITTLRGSFLGGIDRKQDKHYAQLPFLQQRLVSHLSQTTKISDGVEELDEKRDIVHFREIRAQTEYAEKLQAKINMVKEGRTSDYAVVELTEKLKQKEITRDEFNRKVAGKDKEEFMDLTIEKLIGHYYLPVILGNQRAGYIRHVIKVGSEIEFLTALGEWLEKNDVSWDAWMFSKIDETLDKIYIPYYDQSTNEYRSFFPDFIFWMYRKNEYRIVLVDPKGQEHASVYQKIDGYSELFERQKKQKTFKHRHLNVSVGLLMFNSNSNTPHRYNRFWTNDPANIFCPRDYSEHWPPALSTDIPIEAIFARKKYSQANI